MSVLPREYDQRKAQLCHRGLEIMAGVEGQRGRGRGGPGHKGMSEHWVLGPGSCPIRLHLAPGLLSCPRPEEEGKRAEAVDGRRSPQCLLLLSQPVSSSPSKRMKLSSG